MRGVEHIYAGYEASVRAFSGRSLKSRFDGGRHAYKAFFEPPRRKIMPLRINERIKHGAARLVRSAMQAVLRYAASSLTA